jgi:hypothetical protein
MSDTEKVSMNMSVVDLGQIDLLISQGFFSSRTDFIRTAVRNLLQVHQNTVQETVARGSMVLGVAVYPRAMLETLVASGKQLDVKVVGVLLIANDVPPQLARSAFKSITVFGVLRASPEVKAALQDRIR